MMLKNLISGVACGILYVSAVQAQTCTRLPTCEELGFTKSEADCNGKSMIRCPLNKGKVYCEEGKALTSCPPGYADIDIIEPYCKGENVRLVFSDSSLECAKCQSCGNYAYLNKVAGCCPDGRGGDSIDGCKDHDSYGNKQKYNFQDSNGCWTCSKCRNTHTLNKNGNCVAI